MNNQATLSTTGVTESLKDGEVEGRRRNLTCCSRFNMICFGTLPLSNLCLAHLNAPVGCQIATSAEETQPTASLSRIQSNPFPTCPTKHDSMGGLMSGGTQILRASYAACGWRTPADSDHSGEKIGPCRDKSRETLLKLLNIYLFSEKALIFSAIKT